VWHGTDPIRAEACIPPKSEGHDGDTTEDSPAGKRLKRKAIGTSSEQNTSASTASRGPLRRFAGGAVAFMGYASSSSRHQQCRRLIPTTNAASSFLLAVVHTANATATARGSSAGGRMPPDSSNGAGGPQAGGSGGFDRGRGVGCSNWLVCARSKGRASNGGGEIGDGGEGKGRVCVCGLVNEGIIKRFSGMRLFSFRFSKFITYYCFFLFGSAFTHFHAFGFALCWLFTYRCRLKLKFKIIDSGVNTDILR
jgi:hypothetical protein